MINENNLYLSRLIKYYILLKRIEYSYLIDYVVYLITKWNKFEIFVLWTIKGTP